MFKQDYVQPIIEYTLADCAILFVGLIIAIFYWICGAIYEGWKVGESNGM